LFCNMKIVVEAPRKKNFYRAVHSVPILRAY
jgi:hypothetical protein